MFGHFSLKSLNSNVPLRDKSTSLTMQEEQLEPAAQ